MSDLEQLVDELGRRSLESRLGRRGFPDAFDADLWRNLEETGLSRLTVGRGRRTEQNRRSCCPVWPDTPAAVPIAETDLLATWLAGRAGIAVPAEGPLTAVLADAELHDGRITGTAHDVPWPRSAAVVLAARTADGLYVGVLDDPSRRGIPQSRGRASRHLRVRPPGATTCAPLDRQVADEFRRRGAWARCVQIIGALDAARDLTVAHTSERVQFGRPLSKFQAVQHSLAEMAGEIERARAATELAIAAAADFGFDSAATDYAVTVAKVAVGRAVGPVTTIAHQLHGAIGVTVEHRLWLFTMRARSWVDEFGTTAHYARRLGRMALTADDPWQVVVSCPEPR